MKYFFFRFEFKSGYNEYTDQAVIEIEDEDDPLETIDVYLSDMWGSETVKLEKWRYERSDGLIGLTFEGHQEITKEEYDVLRRFI